MLNYISNILIGYNISPDISIILSNITILLIVLLISILAKFITTTILSKNFTKYVKHNKFKWDDIMLKRKVFHRIGDLMPPFIAYFFIPSFSTEFQGILEKVVTTYIMIIILLVISSLLNSINDIYNSYTISKTKPIKGVIQVLQILAFLLGGIIIVSNLMNQNPLIILSSIGAISAVLLVVFKDSLLGLVSGIQIAINDTIRIGDWIEMPKYDANGTVIDISLNTIKVENFDNTITNIPSYAVISNSFKNWRNMEESGGRRIKRSLYVDANSIKFCSTQTLEKFKKIRYISNYIIDKQMEVEEYNKSRNLYSKTSVNARKLTNIGTFREYILQYLKNNPNIHKNMTIMVRQLEPTVNGVPLEIYAFTNVTEWAKYEKIQSDIFDHILSIIPEFNLRLFQSPSGYDIQTALEKNTKTSTKI